MPQLIQTTAGLSFLINNSDTPSKPQSSSLQHSTPPLSWIKNNSIRISYKPYRQIPLTLVSQRIQNPAGLSPLMAFSDMTISFTLIPTTSNSGFYATNMITSFQVTLVKTKQQVLYSGTTLGLVYENMSRTIANPVPLVCMLNPNITNPMAS